MADSCVVIDGGSRRISDFDIHAEACHRSVRMAIDIEK